MRLLGYFCNCTLLFCIIFVLTSCEDHLPNTVFNEEDLNKLNSGGYIDNTHELISKYDTVCLFARDALDYISKEGCKVHNGEAIGLIKDDKCKLFSPGAIQARVMYEMDHRCFSTTENYRISIRDIHGQKHLSIYTKRRYEELLRNKSNKTD